MLRFSVLSSGSIANTFHVRSGNTSILVDAGLPIRQVRERLAAIGENLMDVSAVLVSHDHTDHSKALPSYVNDLHLPIYCSAGTRDALTTKKSIKLPSLSVNEREPDWRIMPEDDAVTIGALRFVGFSVPHDAPQPLGFHIKNGSGSVAVLTDLGWVEGEPEYWLGESGLVFLESNYDPTLLQTCHYVPWQKDRISEWHLANEQAQDVINSARDSQRFVLGHISSTSNQYQQVAQLHRHDARVSVVPPGQPSQVFTTGT